MSDTHSLGSSTGEDARAGSLIAISPQMQAVQSAVRIACTGPQQAVLIAGEDGTGKCVVAQELAVSMGAQFEAFSCEADHAAIRRWLFEVAPLEDGGAPGLVGRGGPRVLYLAHLDAVPREVWADLNELISNLDRSLHEHRVDAELIIIGGYQTGLGRDADPAHVLVRAFTQRVRVPSLNQRGPDLVALAKWFLASRGGGLALSGDAAHLLATVDFTSGNGDLLRHLTNGAADRALEAGTTTIRALDVETAAIDELDFIAPGFDVRGTGISKQEMRVWVEQFPADLRISAIRLLHYCRRHYYCDQGAWWSRLRQLYSMLVEDIAVARPRRAKNLSGHLVLGMLQAPGKSESRVLADLCKAAPFPKSMRRLPLAAIAELLATVPCPLPKDLILVLVDDWMGSGEQMSGLLNGPQADVLRTLSRRVAERGGTLALRLLCIGCHKDAREALDNTPVWRELNGRLHVAWELGREDMCFEPESTVLSDPGVRERFRSFAYEVGKQLVDHPLGWPPGSLLVVFAHDVPNNTLPLLWASRAGVGWNPLRPGLRA